MNNRKLTVLALVALAGVATGHGPAVTITGVKMIGTGAVTLLFEGALVQSESVVESGTKDSHPWLGASALAVLLGLVTATLLNLNRRPLPRSGR